MSSSPSSSDSETETNEGRLEKLFMIESEMNGKALHIRKGRKGEGIPVIMYEAKTSKMANQLWYLDSSGHIRTYLNDMVFQADNEGEPLKTTKYSSDVRGHWIINGNKIINGLGQCLTIMGHKPHYWVCAYRPTGGVNQSWDIKYIFK